VPGSHKLGILRHDLAGSYYSNINAQDAAKIAKGAQDVKPGEYLTSVNFQDMKVLEPQAIDVVCEPGDLVLFSNLLVHRGGENSTDTIRWSLDWRFQDASKSTHRAENGHVVWQKRKSNNCNDDMQEGELDIVVHPKQWIRRSLL